MRLMHDLRKAGYLISIPFGEDHRYDIIAEKDDRFYRVQVKTGRLRKGSSFSMLIVRMRIVAAQ